MYIQLVIMQIISLAVAGINFFILPRAFNIVDYGYLQLYFLITSLSGFLHLGSVDGLQLKLGGAGKKFFEYYFGDVLVVMVIVIFFIAITYALWILVFDKFQAENFLILGAILSGILVNLMTAGSFLLYSLGQGRKSLLAGNYSRGSYVLGVMASVLVLDSYIYLILIFTLTTIFGIIKEFNYIQIQFKINNIRRATLKYYKCIKIGSKILLANGSTQLFLAFSAFFVQSNFGVSSFAKIAFANGLVLMAISFGYTIGGIVYSDACKRKINGNSDLRPLLLIKNTIIICGSLLSLVLIIDFVILKWINKYSESILFINLMFICVLFDGLYSIVILPLMKYYRRETIIFRLNLIILSISLIAMISLSYFSYEPYFYVLVTSLSFISRSMLGLILIAKLFKLNIKVPVLLITVLTIAYILSVTSSDLQKIMILLTPIICILLYSIKNNLLNIPFRIR